MNSRGSEDGVDITYRRCTFLPGLTPPVSPGPGLRSPMRPRVVRIGEPSRRVWWAISPRGYQQRATCRPTWEVVAVHSATGTDIAGKPTCAFASVKLIGIRAGLSNEAASLRQVRSGR
jgi:hypothetical protein